MATRVQALQAAIAAGDFDRRTLDENLLLELHRHICADLIPELAIHPDYARLAGAFATERLRQLAMLQPSVPVYMSQLAAM